MARSALKTESVGSEDELLQAQEKAVSRMHRPRDGGMMDKKQNGGVNNMGQADYVKEKEHDGDRDCVHCHDRVMRLEAEKSEMKLSM